jgi:hypothetical protein
VTPESAVLVVQKFLALEEAPVERLTTKGMRRMDARSAVVTIDVHGAYDDSDTGVDSDATDDIAGRPGASSGTTTLRMVLSHTVPAVRPDDVLSALRDVSDVIPAAPALITRLAQGSLGESGVVKL